MPTPASATRHEKKKGDAFLNLGTRYAARKRELPPAGDARGRGVPSRPATDARAKRRKVAKEVPSHGAAPVEAAAAAGEGTGAGATPELAGDCFMVASRGHAGASLVAHEHGAGAARRRCQTDSARRRMAGSFLAETTYSTTTTCLGVVAPDAALGERRGGASPTTRAAPHEDQGRPLERETERGGAELLASWCVASGVKKETLLASLFFLVFLRDWRERKRR